MATTESSGPPPDEIKFVNKGLRAPFHNPKNPQAYLEKSNHPYAPFTGNSLTWESFVFDDGSTFEGLCREEVPHGKGVIVFGNGWGGGIQQTNNGDMFEGELYAGFAHGLGMYSSPKSGEVYRGEYYAGKRQGCGVLMNYGPFHKLLDKGENPGAAWDKTKDKIFESAKYGTWKKDYFVSGPEETGRFCHINEIKGTLEELESVLTQVRMFRYKPEGEVSTFTAQDASGKPVEPLQDPLLYPHGTKYLAPGPAGQCFPVPEDERLKGQLVAHAKNHKRIWDMYNLEYDAAPGSDLWKAERWWKKEQEKQKAEREKMYEKQERRRRLMERRFDGTDEGTSVASSGSGPPRVLASISMQLARGADSVGKALQSVAFQRRPRLARPSRRSP
ncbi:hypothetical protein BSKO_02979 [Bryopsis sp. KO-2023]|nr:hypothetical protein BSKO_02979 [Bryopsis sp. KO-2023]